MTELTPVPLERDRVRFGCFFLYRSTRQLRHNATTVPLKPKQVELLILLAQRLGSPVSRDEIMKALWGPQKATDYALSQTVYRLRRALEAFDPSTDYVQTVSGFGFRLVAPATAGGKLGRLPFSDPAFEPCRQALFMLNEQTQPKILASIGSFQDALARDPSFVPALVGLAQSYTDAGIRSFIEPLTAYYQAKAALSKAVALDPGSADAFTLLSLLALFFDVNLGRARDAAELAVALDPHSAKSPKRHGVATACPSGLFGSAGRSGPRRFARTPPTRIPRRCLGSSCICSSAMTKRACTLPNRCSSRLTMRRHSSTMPVHSTCCSDTTTPHRCSTESPPPKWHRGSSRCAGALRSARGASES